MYYIKLRYIFEDIYRNVFHYFQKRFRLPPPKYRISFVERDKESHRLVNERIMKDDITDINLLSQKYVLILKAFNKKKSSEIPKNPNNRFYVESSEMRKKLKKIAFARVL